MAATATAPPADGAPTGVTAAEVAELEAVRRDVEAMATQVQRAAQQLQARIADVDRREAELERRRLEIAQRHESQLRGIEDTTRRVVAEMQAKLDAEVSRSREKEMAVQDAAARLGAVQRDYDLLQSAMLRVQSRDVERHESTTKAAQQLQEVKDALSDAVKAQQALVEENAALRDKAQKHHGAMLHYRGLYKAAVEQHNALAADVRRAEAARLAEDQHRVEMAGRKVELDAARRDHRPQRSGAEHVWTHDMVLEAARPQHDPSDAAATKELKMLVHNLAAEIDREEEQRRHAARKAQRKALRRAQRDAAARTAEYEAAAAAAAAVPLPADVSSATEAASTRSSNSVRHSTASSSTGAPHGSSQRHGGTAAGPHHPGDAPVVFDVSDDSPPPSDTELYNAGVGMPVGAPFGPHATVAGPGDVVSRYTHHGDDDDDSGHEGYF